MTAYQPFIDGIQQYQEKGMAKMINTPRDSEE